MRGKAVAEEKEKRRKKLEWGVQRACMQMKTICGEADFTSRPFKLTI